MFLLLLQLQPKIFNYNYNYSSSSNCNSSTISITITMKDSQNIAINSLAYEASSFAFVNAMDLFFISIPDLPIKALFLSILVLPSIVV